MNDADIAYPPLDVPKPVADGIWIVDSGPLRAMGLIPVPVRMTVIRLEGGALILHSPTRFGTELHDMLASLGRIGHLVAPNVAHWTFLREWQARIPEATSWGAPRLAARRQVRRSGTRLDHTLSDSPPEIWAGEIDQIVVPGIGGFNEVAFFHRATRTMILADLVQNFETGKLPPALGALVRIAGNAAPNGRAPAWLRAIVRMKGEPARRAARRLVALRPERVIFAHGRWFEKEGANRLERSLAWLTG
jgi:hypothetical protein